MRTIKQLVTEALTIINTERWYVSESTVYRILKREGLIKAAELVGFKAGKEYHRKQRGQMSFGPLIVPISRLWAGAGTTW